MTKPTAFKKIPYGTPSLAAWTFVIVGMSHLYFTAYLPETALEYTKIWEPLHEFQLLLVPYTVYWTYLFSVATFMHIVEGIGAGVMCINADLEPEIALFWILQTVLAGVFSLRLLRKRLSDMKKSE
eukprot:TRINITY_DN6299_c0_g1_i1.p1 TRINITY_DN6299_c0_g1~~TRINITY_DN6299_c0_g1_i1.p1  ORF type:complete len:126 (-),score=28.80 TRINITY_DN6299_c0_g1_i1:150-527(-)